MCLNMTPSPPMLPRLQPQDDEVQQQPQVPVPPGHSVAAVPAWLSTAPVGTASVLTALQERNCAERVTEEVMEAIRWAMEMELVQFDVTPFRGCGWCQEIYFTCKDLAVNHIKLHLRNSFNAFEEMLDLEAADKVPRQIKCKDCKKPIFVATNLTSPERMALFRHHQKGCDAKSRQMISELATILPETATTTFDTEAVNTVPNKPALMLCPMCSKGFRSRFSLGKHGPRCSGWAKSISEVWLDSFQRLEPTCFFPLCRADLNVDHLLDGHREMEAAAEGSVTLRQDGYTCRLCTGEEDQRWPGGPEGRVSYMLHLRELHWAVDGAPPPEFFRKYNLRGERLKPAKKTKPNRNSAALTLEPYNDYPQEVKECPEMSCLDCALRFDTAVDRSKHVCEVRRCTDRSPPTARLTDGVCPLCTHKTQQGKPTLYLEKEDLKKHLVLAHAQKYFKKGLEPTFPFTCTYCLKESPSLTISLENHRELSLHIGLRHERLYRYLTHHKTQNLKFLMRRLYPDKFRGDRARKRKLASPASTPNKVPKLKIKLSKPLSPKSPIRKKYKLKFKDFSPTNEDSSSASSPSRRKGSTSRTPDGLNCQKCATNHKNISELRRHLVVHYKEQLKQMITVPPREPETGLLRCQEWKNGKQCERRVKADAVYYSHLGETHCYVDKCLEEEGLDINIQGAHSDNIVLVRYAHKKSNTPTKRVRPMTIRKLSPSSSSTSSKENNAPGSSFSDESMSTQSPLITSTPISDPDRNRLGDTINSPPVGGRATPTFALPFAPPAIKSPAFKSSGWICQECDKTFTSEDLLNLHDCTSMYSDADLDADASLRSARPQLGSLAESPGSVAGSSNMHSPASLPPASPFPSPLPQYRSPAKPRAIDSRSVSANIADPFVCSECNKQFASEATKFLHTCGSYFDDQIAKDGSVRPRPVVSMAESPGSTPSSNVQESPMYTPSNNARESPMFTPSSSVRDTPLFTALPKPRYYGPTPKSVMNNDTAISCLKCFEMFASAEIKKLHSCNSLMGLADEREDRGERPAEGAYKEAESPAGTEHNTPVESPVVAASTSGNTGNRTAQVLSFTNGIKRPKPGPKCSKNPGNLSESSEEEEDIDPNGDIEGEAGDSDSTTNKLKRKKGSNGKGPLCKPKRSEEETEEDSIDPNATTVSYTSSQREYLTTPFTPSGASESGSEYGSALAQSGASKSGSEYRGDLTSSGASKSSSEAALASSGASKSGSEYGGALTPSGASMSGSEYGGTLALSGASKSSSEYGPALASSGASKSSSEYGAALASSGASKNGSKNGGAQTPSGASMSGSENGGAQTPSGASMSGSEHGGESRDDESISSESSSLLGLDDKTCSDCRRRFNTSDERLKHYLSDDCHVFKEQRDKNMTDEEEEDSD